MICNCGLTKHYDDAKCDIDNANGGDDDGGGDYAMMMMVMIMELMLRMVTMT